MGNVKEFAQRELKELFGENNENDFYKGMVPQSVLELIDVFEKQGHSGCSAPIVAKLFNKLALYEPVTPILDTKDQWDKVSGGGFQHKKCYGLFKDGKNSRPYYIDAFSKKLRDGSCWSGPVFCISKEDKPLLWKAYVKKWPFTPKTFFLPCDESEYFYLTDRKEFDAMCEYYDVESVKYE